MTIKKASWLAVRIALLCTGFILVSWGKYGHEHINRAAVMTLPQPMQTFFYNHVDFMTVEANLPDVRKYTIGDSAEFRRHHIHLEAYGKFEDIPKGSKEIKAKYDDKFLDKHGTLPWYVQDMMVKLTDAFKNKHKSDILMLSADLGHYIGDAYMPLHTSQNHNGTMTNPKGVHGLFEGRVPELFGESYNYNAGKVHYIADVQSEIWRIVETSNLTADTLLKIDRDVTAAFDKSRIYEMDNAKPKKNMYGDVVHTVEYATAYHTRLKGMVERRMRSAITSTASFWYTAWVNAGKPELSGMDAPELTKRNASDLAHDRALFVRGKLFGIKSEKEF